MSVELQQADDRTWHVVIDGSVAQTLHNCHTAVQCFGTSCVLHRPSDHPLRNADLMWDENLTMFFRLCFHGKAVLDPDTVEYVKAHSEFAIQDSECGCGFVLKFGPLVECLACGEQLWSRYRHDFRRCQCGATAVDGGGWYTRILGSSWAWVDDSAPSSSRE